MLSPVSPTSSIAGLEKKSMKRPTKYKRNDDEDGDNAVAYACSTYYIQ